MPAMVKQSWKGSIVGFVGSVAIGAKAKSSCINLSGGAKTAKPFDGL
jgi:hypothetical protein